MKKTFNINLAGYPFIIDDDAYNLLKDYLDTINTAFSKTEDGAELAADIENRIAELLMEYDPESKKIVSLEDVSKMIARIGQPEEILEIDETLAVSDNTDEKISEQDSPTPPLYTGPSKKKWNNFNFNFKKRLFRDPQNALLGGVCSGIAHYFNIDPTLVRILTVLLIFLSATTVGIAYIILWIIVPEATTPMQRMEMMGEEPTMENIGKKVTENYISPEIQSEHLQDVNGTSFIGFIGKCFSIMLKILITIGLVIGFIVLFSLIIGLFGCIIALIVVGVNLISKPQAYGELGEHLNFWLDKTEWIPFYGIICGIGGIITLGVPLFLLLRMGWNNQKRRTVEMSLGKRRSLLIAWIVGVIILTLSIIKIVRLSTLDDYTHNLIEDVVDYISQEDYYVEIEEPDSIPILDKEKLKADVIETVKETIIPIVDDEYLKHKKMSEKKADVTSTDSIVIKDDIIKNDSITN